MKTLPLFVALLAATLLVACGDGGQPVATPASTEEPADTTLSPTAAPTTPAAGTVHTSERS